MYFFWKYSSYFYVFLFVFLLICISFEITLLICISSYLLICIALEGTLLICISFYFLLSLLIPPLPCTLSQKSGSILLQLYFSNMVNWISTKPLTAFPTTWLRFSGNFLIWFTWVTVWHGLSTQRARKMKSRGSKGPPVESGGQRYIGKSHKYMESQANFINFLQENGGKKWPFLVSWPWRFCAFLTQPRNI